ncbi:unnamed protein product [Moneuplotes crassus]|uniref:Uncharacterized protein n=1 Tax=Euplotes crassus TaxID=5936 RepID=A0AAD1Y9F9_EUPCR|nr:unnamed protein product [Moneuplotes crassus]
MYSGGITKTSSTVEFPKRSYSSCSSVKKYKNKSQSLIKYSSLHYHRPRKQKKGKSCNKSPNNGGSNCSISNCSYSNTPGIRLRDSAKCGSVFLRNLPPIKDNIRKFNTNDIYSRWVKLFMRFCGHNKLEISLNKKSLPFLKINMTNTKINLLPVRQDQSKMNYFTIKIYNVENTANLTNTEPSGSEDLSIHIGCKMKEQVLSWYQYFMAIQTRRKPHVLNQTSNPQNLYNSYVNNDFINISTNSTNQMRTRGGNPNRESSLSEMSCYSKQSRHKHASSSKKFCNSIIQENKKDVNLVNLQHPFYQTIFKKREVVINLGELKKKIESRKSLKKRKKSKNPNQKGQSKSFIYDPPSRKSLSRPKSRIRISQDKEKFLTKNTSQFTHTDVNLECVISRMSQNLNKTEIQNQSENLSFKQFCQSKPQYFKNLKYLIQAEEGNKADYSQEIKHTMETDPKDSRAQIELENFSPGNFGGGNTPFCDITNMDNKYPPIPMTRQAQDPVAPQVVESPAVDSFKSDLQKNSSAPNSKSDSPSLSFKSCKMSGSDRESQDETLAAKENSETNIYDKLTTEILNNPGMSKNSPSGAEDIKDFDRTLAEFTTMRDCEKPEGNDLDYRRKDNCHIF